MWATNLVYAALGWNPGKLLPSKPYTPDPSMMFSNREGRLMAQSQLKLARPSDQKTMTEGKQGIRVAFFGHWSINEHTPPSLLGPGSQYISEKISPSESRLHRQAHCGSRKLTWSMHFKVYFKHLVRLELLGLTVTR